MCASKVSPANLSCTTIPGTAPTRASRFIGASGAPPAEADVCLP